MGDTVRTPIGKAHPVSRSITLGDLRQSVGKEIGVSSWKLIDQDRVTRFAEATDDFQFIHTDPERAAATPFGGTIAHGFLTLSLLSAFSYEVVGEIEGAAFTVNYGFNAIRMLSPVRTGKRLRARFVLRNMVERKPGQWQLVFDVAGEIEGEEKPAFAAEWLVVAMADSAKDQ